MSKEQSFGIIPIRKRGGAWEVLLVQLHAGHWGFPKGHAIQNEEPLETAKRELLEETGLSVIRLLSEETFIESFWYNSHGSLIHKDVIYFLAETAGNAAAQPEEIKDIKWVPFKQCEQYLTFPATRSVLQQALSTLYE